MFSHQRSRQAPHNPFKSHQSHGIRRKGPGKARHETPPVPPPAFLPPDIPRRIPPPLVLSLAVVEPCCRRRRPRRRAERVRHDALLDHVGRIARQPEDLRAEAAGPEVDGRRAEGRVAGEVGGEQGVGAPPEEEEGAEDQRREEAVVEAGEAMGAELGWAREVVLVRASGFCWDPGEWEWEWEWGGRRG